MKNIYYLLAIIVFVINNSCGQQAIIMETNYAKQFYKIEKIKEETSLYVIYATRNDSTFKIVSMKTDLNSNCKKIKKKNSYKLDLKKNYPPDTLFGKSFHASYAEPQGMEYPGKIIVMTEEKSHYALYSVKILDGLCISSEKP